MESLKRDFLGGRQMEVRLRGALDGAAHLLPDEAVLVTSGEGWLRYRTDNPQETNPRVLHLLDEAGLQVVTLAEVERSLEDVYLQVVNQPKDEGG